ASIFCRESNRSDDLREGVRKHLQDLCSGAVIGSGKNGDGDCLITGIPAQKASAVKSESRVYNIKSSAFSYRSGRPETRYSAKTNTLLSEVSEAEYKIRRAQADRHSVWTGKGFPARIFSPVSFGLFGGVVFNLGDSASFSEQVRHL